MGNFPHQYTALGEGVSFGSIPMDRFHSSLLAVSLILPLSRETVTENALVSLMLGKSTRDYPTYRLFSRRLGQLYGAIAGSSVQKLGDEESLTFVVSTIDSSLALGGEDLLKESAELLLSMLFRPMIENGAFAEETFRIQKKYLPSPSRRYPGERRSRSAKGLWCGPYSPRSSSTGPFSRGRLRKAWRSSIRRESPSSSASPEGYRCRGSDRPGSRCRAWTERPGSCRCRFLWGRR